MNKAISILWLCCIFLTPTFAQYIAIPDANFEQALIDFGVDSEGTLDGQILISDANSQTGLSIINRNVTDFTGIEAFVNIQLLDVSYNTNLVSLNTTFNTLIQSINTEGCAALTTLNLASNTALTSVNFFDNDISSLDLTNNTLLETIDVRFNQITSLDLSGHTSLTSFNAKNNALTFLDMRNGNNAIVSFFDSDFNIDLVCIYVDDASAAYHATWTISFYSTLVNNEAECNTLSAQDEALNASFNIYYRSNDVIIKSIIHSGRLKVYDLSGKLVIDNVLNIGENIINTSPSLNKGLYIAKITLNNKTISKKIIL